MKLFKIHTLLAVFLLLAGCSEDDSFSSVEVERGRRVGISVCMPDNQRSRVEYNPDEDLPAFSWEDNDQIYLLGYDDSGVYMGKEIFNLQEGQADDEGVFVGYLVKGATQYHVCYISKQLSVTADGGTTIDYSGQTQAGDNSAEHVRDYLLLKTSYMITEDAFVDESLDDDISLFDDSDDSESVRLTMQNSIMRFNIQGMNERIGTLQSITWVTNVDETDSRSQTVSFVQDVTSKPDATVYFCFDPSQMELAKENYMHVEFNGSLATYVASGKSAKGMTYRAGKRYYINIKDTIEPQADALRWIPQQTGAEIWLKTIGNVAPVLDAAYTSLTVDKMKDVDGIKYQVLKSSQPEIKEIEAFHNGENLLLTNADQVTNVYLPEGLTTLPDNAFRDFTGLDTVYVPKTLHTIGNYVFEGCKSLRAFKAAEDDAAHAQMDGRVLVVDDELIRCVPTAGSTLDMNGVSVSGMREAAFKDCVELNSVRLPAGIKEIPRVAFQNCKALTTADFYGNVTTIGESAFEGCSVLNSCTVFKEGTTPSLVTLGVKAFKDCKGLTTVFLPNTLTTLPVSAFQGCITLAALTFGNAVTEIGESAFNGCTSLKPIRLPETLTTIQPSAFEGCTSVIRLLIPKNVTTIGANALKGCTALKTMIVQTPYHATIDTNLFGGPATRDGMLFIHNDWRTTGKSTFGETPNIWMSQTWNRVTFINVDGSTGVDPNPGYEDGIK